MQKRLLFLAICAFWFSGLRAQDHYERLQQVDIQDYRFEIDINDDNDEIRGRTHVLVAFKETVKSWELDLVSKGESGKGMEVTSVTQEGEAIKFEQEGDRLRLFPKMALEGVLLNFDIEYHGIPADGLIISKNMHGNRTFFGDNWPNRAHHYLPTVDHPSDKARVEFVVTAPEGYQVVSNGWQMEETNLPDGMKRTRWRSSVVLPTKVMVFGAAAFAVQQSGMVGNIPVSAWVYPEQAKEGWHDYALAVDILEFFVQRVAPYPYEKLANVQSRTRYGGMENAGCIFYAEGSVTGGRSSEGLLAHEIAHQWFGNSASEANWHHIWLSEGFATFWTHVWFEEKVGREMYAKRLQADREKILAWPGTQKRPILDTLVTNWNRLLNSNSYEKGGWVLHMLRKQIGDKPFFKGVQSYYQAFHLKNALSSDLQKIMEETSGTKLGWFFDQWLRRPGFPELDVKWSWKKENLTVTIRQTQGAEPYRFYLDLECKPKSGKSFYKTVEVTEREQQFELSLPQAPSEVLLDPFTSLLYKGSIRKK